MGTSAIAVQQESKKAHPSHEFLDVIEYTVILDTVRSTARGEVRFPSQPFGRARLTQFIAVESYGMGCWEQKTCGWRHHRG